MVSRLPQHARKKKGSHSPGMHGAAAKRPRLEEAMADRTRKTCTGRKWNRTAGESEPKGPSAVRGQLVPSEALTRRTGPPPRRCLENEPVPPGTLFALGI